MSPRHRFMILKHSGSFIQNQAVSFTISITDFTDEKESVGFRDCKRGPWPEQGENPYFGA